MKRLFTIIALFAIMLSICSCKEKPIQEYHGWIVIEMHKSYDIGHQHCQSRDYGR